MAKELSPSEYKEMVRTGKAERPDSNKYTKPAFFAVGVLVLCGLSFGLGASYQKGKTPNAATENNQTANNGQPGPQGMGGGGRGGFGNGQRPNVGTVTAISSDSITISGRTGTDQTFKITSNTTVQNNGSAASISDIKSGDTVFITTDTADTSTATQIMLNPNPGGGRPMSTPQPTTNGDADAI